MGVSPTILDFCESERHARPFLGGPSGDLSSWSGWFSVLRAIYGMPIRSRQDKAFFERVTDRSVKNLPPAGFDTSLLLTGRRSGKSRVASVVAGFEALYRGHHTRMAPGETAIVACVSPTKAQAAIVKSYVLGLLSSSPVLRKKIKRETKHEIELTNGITIAVLSGNWRSVRGFTLAALVIDECCFFQNSDEAKISDGELVRALKPGLATLNGKLVAISSPYAKKGWAYRQWKRHFGKDSPNTLVVNAASRVLNPTLPQSVVDDALADDLASAKAEFFAEWRDDIANYITRATVEACVVQGRTFLPPAGEQYFGFVDMSGGQKDAAALAIAHKEHDRVVVDRLNSWPSPHNPYSVIRQMADDLREYGLRFVRGDRYAAEFVSRAFTDAGIRFKPSELTRSELYLELLPRLSAGQIELLDNPKLVDEIAGLERRTRSGGRDSVDHAQGASDDLANAVAGASWLATKRRLTLGSI